MSLQSAVLSNNKTHVHLLVELKPLHLAIYEDETFKRFSIGLMGYKQLDYIYRKNFKDWMWYVQWAFSYPWFHKFKLEIPK